MKFSNKVLKVIGKEGVDTDFMSTDNCNELQVVKLRVVNKGVNVERVACLKLDRNRNGRVCCELKNISSVLNSCCRWFVNI